MELEEARLQSLLNPGQEREERKKQSEKDKGAAIFVDLGGDNECGGCCFAGLCSFVGEPRGQPDSNEPHGGWGYTPCCSSAMHFDCLGQHLNPFDKLVESTSGEVQMALACPACRSTLSRSRRRMLGGQVRKI